MSKTKDLPKKKKGMLQHKNMKRLRRRCAAMLKVATFMMVLILLSGLLNRDFEVANRDMKIRGFSEVQLQPRHQRMDEPNGVNREVNDVTITHATPSENTAKEKGKEPLVARIANHETQSTQASSVNVVKLELWNQIRPKIGLESSNIEYEKLNSEHFKQRETKIRTAWRRQMEQKKFDESPPNPSFVFHNKLPKSGSSTMNNILKKLSKANNFNFLKMETSDYQKSDDAYLVKHLEGKIREPYMLLKHHRWLNFTKSDRAQPTYINVMRDPLEWFTSRYYFTRYGWERKPGCRKADCGMSEEDRKMEIDECVKKRHRECLSPWMYLQFFCGTAPECYNITTLEQKERATEIAKYNILHEYYVVGVLEQFEDTLKLFETMMPKYFKNAVPTWKSEFVQTKQRMTRTTYKKEMSEKSKNFFRNGPLHFEIELYNFARELFNEKLKRFNIKSTVTI